MYVCIYVFISEPVLLFSPVWLRESSTLKKFIQIMYNSKNISSIRYFKLCNVMLQVDWFLRWSKLNVALL